MSGQADALCFKPWAFFEIIMMRKSDCESHLQVRFKWPLYNHMLLILEIATELHTIGLLSLRTSRSAALSSSVKMGASLAIFSPLSNKFQVASSTEARMTRALLEQPFFFLEGFWGQFTNVVTYNIRSFRMLSPTIK